MGPPPVVTGISPKEGPPGTKVTIRGEFLGTTVTDLIGLKICGCDCLLSAEWKSKNKIVARSGPCKGRGDIIVTTKSGGEGTSTVQFRGYHESIGPVKESAVWVEEAAPVSLPWGRRPISPTTYTPPDPLGLSTEGDECKFPEEELHELFPDGSGDLADDNFEPLWYLIEHHSNTSYEDLKAGMVFLQRKVESQKEGQISFLKANTGAVMDQLDRLVLFKNMFEEDQRKNGKEPLPTLQAAIEKSISLADSLFSDILSRKESTDKTREALSLLTRHKFLFQLPASIDKNIKRKDFDLVVNDYTRVKNLFGNTDVKLFQKILAEIDQKIDDLKENLVTRIQTMPISIQEQRKYIRLLISLNWDGDAAWIAINSRKDYLIKVMNKIKEHFKQEEKEVKRKAKDPREGEWSAGRGACCSACCGAAAHHLPALWTLARAYFAGELGGAPAAADRHHQFKQMILSSVEVLSSVVRWCVLSGGGAAPLDLVRARLTANLHSLREAYDVLIKLDLPSQPLSIVEKVIYDYRVHGMTVFLNKTLKDVKAIGEKETWNIEEFTDYGAITSLPRLVEQEVSRCVSLIVQCVWGGGRREGPLDAGKDLHGLLHQILMAYVGALQQGSKMDSSDEKFISSCLSEALCVSGEERAPGRGPLRRLLLAGANARYSRHVTLHRLAAVFRSNGLPQPTAVFETVSNALSGLESTIAEMYLDHKGDPLVGTIETSMYMGHRLEPDSPVDDARPYLYEIINNLIAVHAEVDSVSGSASGRYMRDIVETVCEEVSRLSADAPPTRAAALTARLEYTLLRLALAPHLTRKAENYLMDAIASLPPLESEADLKHMEVLIQRFKKRMELQLASLNCNTETV